MTSVVQRVIEQALKASELTYSKHPGAHGASLGLVVELPGERKLKTNTILSIGEHSVRVEAFVCRKPDENHEGVYRFLLKRNRRLYGVAYTLDNVGDIYLVGRMALASVTPDEIDRVLGQVLEAVDSDFNTSRRANRSLPVTPLPCLRRRTKVLLSPYIAQGPA